MSADFLGRLVVVVFLGFFFSNDEIWKTGVKTKDLKITVTHLKGDHHSDHLDLNFF